VLLDLERRGVQISYLRTAGEFEVDFLARYPEAGEELLQVCADLDAPATRALLAAGTERSGVTLRLISLAPENPGELPRGIVWHATLRWKPRPYPEPLQQYLLLREPYLKIKFS
jgi:hypothetical protein